MTTIHIDTDKMLGLLGDDGEHWLKGGWGDEQSMCLHGAIRRCQPVPGDAYLIEQVANRKGWGTVWNDDKDRTWADVKALILAGIDVTDQDLEETFGPQWEAIVALVRRAAVLTDDEARQLDAARSAARDAARDAAGDAVRSAATDAAWNAAWGAAWSAAWDAARSAAWSAAWDAARALAIRDLIGQHGFTQNHYDLLTRSWATVIGPVHPDDVANS